MTATYSSTVLRLEASGLDPAFPRLRVNVESPVGATACLARFDCAACPSSPPGAAACQQFVQGYDLFEENVRGFIWHIFAKEKSVNFRCF